MTRSSRRKNSPPPPRHSSSTDGLLSHLAAAPPRKKHRVSLRYAHGNERARQRVCSARPVRDHQPFARYILRLKVRKSWGGGVVRDQGVCSARSACDHQPFARHVLRLKNGKKKGLPPAVRLLTTSLDVDRRVLYIPPLFRHGAIGHAYSNVSFSTENNIFTFKIGCDCCAPQRATCVTVFPVEIYRFPCSLHLSSVDEHTLVI